MKREFALQTVHAVGQRLHTSYDLNQLGPNLGPNLTTYIRGRVHMRDEARRRRDLAVPIAHEI